MKRRAFLTTLVPAAGSAWAAQVASSKLPKPYHTPSANNRPRVIARPDGAQLSLPQGFQIDEFAAGFERPRFMLQGSSGEILLTDSTNKGKVYVIEDKDKDNKAEARKVLIDGLDRPYGLAFWRDYLYVAETTSLKRYKYDRKAMTVSAGEEIFPMKDYAKGHWTRTVLFDRKNEKLYLSIGSESNVSTGEPEQRAAILQMNPDGSAPQIYAAGTRNPIGMRWQPGSDTLWAAIQERDGLGDDLAPDFFTSIKQGGYYGWPYAYAGPNEEPRNAGQRTDLVKKTIVPDVLLGAHVAVLDFIFYQGKQFPAKYRGGALLALHGSWNRSERVGYSVVFVPFKNGKPASAPEDFLTGWMLGKDKAEVWGRPVGLIELPDGSILVSDDGGNRIWRISYKG